MLPLLAILPALSFSQPTDSTHNEALFLEAWQITRSAFYDPDMHGVDWPAVRDELLPRAAATTSQAELSAVINDALSRLHASHSAHYTPDQREYYEILDVFWPDGVPGRPGSAIHAGPVEYIGIGLASTVIDGHTFAKDVYQAGPAAKAGILIGDELISVEDAPWSDIAPFRTREGVETHVQIRRAADEPPQTVTVTPIKIHPRELFLESMDAGAHIIQSAAAKRDPAHPEAPAQADLHSIAYIHIRSYANPAYHENLKDHLSGDFADADALIIDLRGGWGGASPDYMDIFNPIAPSLTQTDREGKVRTIDPTWRKPTAILIDAGTRSGKEMLAYAIKKHHLAALVGDNTAGAVLGGSVRPLSDGTLLYIAVSDVTVDGVRLEGIGVPPDIAIPRPIPYSAGADPQLQAAITALTNQLRP